MKKLRLLVAYSAQTMVAQTIIDYVYMLKQMEGFDVSFVHVTHNAVLDFDLSEFDVVFNNYCARHCFEGYVSQDYVEKLKRYRGLKVISVQDDGDRTSILHKAIRDIGFHVLITAVPQDTLNYGYPPDQLPNVEIFPALTGYVPHNIEELQKYILPLRERPTLIGYRGRDIGGRYGLLGFYKFEIGRRMKEACEQRGLNHDISMREEDRIYGMDWFGFMGRCRAVLGTESGSNVWDFDGSIERRFREMAAELGRPPSYMEFLPLVEETERHSNIGEVSPRHFEAAALRTPMVMIRGRYSDILEPWTHYIPVEKDFSNVGDVLRALEDFDLLERIVERTYADLVTSGQYTYQSFGAKLGAMIRRKHAELIEQNSGGIFVPVMEPAGTSDAPEYCERPTSIPYHQKHFLLRENRRTIKYYLAEIDRLNEILKVQISALQGRFPQPRPLVEALERLEALMENQREWGVDPSQAYLLNPASFEKKLKGFVALLTRRREEFREILTEATPIAAKSFDDLFEFKNAEEAGLQHRAEEIIKSRVFDCISVLQNDIGDLARQVGYPVWQSSMILDLVGMSGSLRDLGQATIADNLVRELGQILVNYLTLHGDTALGRRQQHASLDLQGLSDHLTERCGAWRQCVTIFHRRKELESCIAESGLLDKTLRLLVRYFKISRLLTWRNNQRKDDLSSSLGESLTRIDLERAKLQRITVVGEIPRLLEDGLPLDEILSNEEARVAAAREIVILQEKCIAEVRAFLHTTSMYRFRSRVRDLSALNKGLLVRKAARKIMRKLPLANR